MTLTYAGAPHRSHRSLAFSGFAGAIAPVMSASLARFPPTGLPTVSRTCDLYASQHLARLVSSHAGAAYAVGEHITDHGSDLCTSRSADQVVADQRLRNGLGYGVARHGRRSWRLPFDADNSFGAG